MASKKSLFERIPVQDDYFGFVWVVARIVLLCVCIHLYFSFSSTKNNLREQLINLSHSAKAGIAEDLKHYEETFLKVEKKIFDYKSSSREKYVENIQDIIEDIQKSHGIDLSWVDNAHAFPHSDYHMVESQKLYLEMKKAFETHSKKIFMSPIQSLDVREGGTGVFRIIYPVLKNNVLVGFLFSKIKISRILRNAAKEFGGGR